MWGRDKIELEIVEEKMVLSDLEYTRKMEKLADIILTTVRLVQAERQGKRGRKIKLDLPPETQSILNELLVDGVKV